MQERVGRGGIRTSNIIGFDKVIRSLNAEILLITGGTRGGLIRAAKYIKRDVETNQPLTPVLTENLRLSFEIHSLFEGQLNSNRKFGVRFGYSAGYALWVHEMVDAKHWSRDGSGPKWLERSINRNHDTLLQIIADGIKPVI